MTPLGFSSWLEMNNWRRFVPTRYSLRHGNYTASNSLCSWVLEGTTNLLDWVVLREHSNDSSLANPFVWASWTISQEKQVRSLSEIAPKTFCAVTFASYHVSSCCRRRMPTEPLQRLGSSWPLTRPRDASSVEERLLQPNPPSSPVFPNRFHRRRQVCLTSAAKTM